MSDLPVFSTIGTNKSVTLSLTTADAEVELPKTDQGDYATFYAVQQTPTTTSATFTTGPTGTAHVFGQGLMVPADGHPIVFASGLGKNQKTNNFLIGIMVSGSATLVITPLGN